MFCPRCQQLVRKAIFGVACGCAVLSGHAEEPPHTKFYLLSSAQQPVITTSTSVAPSVGYADFMKVIAQLRGTDTT